MTLNYQEVFFNQNHGKVKKRNLFCILLQGDKNDKNKDRLFWCWLVH